MPATSQDAGAAVGADTSGHATKKGKQKKAVTPVDSNASKLLKHRIAQLEQDAAGEKDQELEIGEPPSPPSPTHQPGSRAKLTLGRLQSARSSEPTAR